MIFVIIKLCVKKLEAFLLVITPIYLFYGLSSSVGLIINIVDLVKVNNYHEIKGKVFEEDYMIVTASYDRLGGSSSFPYQGSRRVVLFNVNNEEFSIYPPWLSSEYTIGKSIKVLYDPQNPENAIVSKELHIEGIKFRILLTLIIYAICFISIYRIYFHFRRRKKVFE